MRQIFRSSARLIVRPEGLILLAVIALVMSCASQRMRVHARHGAGARVVATSFRIAPERPVDEPIHDGVSRTFGEVVHQELTARGYRAVSGPELVVRYSVAIRLQQHGYEMRGSNSAPGPEGAGSGGTKVEWSAARWEARFTLTFEDAATGDLRWTAVAEGPVEPGADFDEFLATLRGVVGRMLDELD